jgi:FKBP-type peptidyl-prolyl cis-trans isomerase FkpA
LILRIKKCKFLKLIVLTKGRKMKKTFALSALVMSLILVSCKGGKVDLKTDEDKTFYTLGTMFGSRLNNLELSEKEIDALAAGLRDSAGKKELQVKPEEFQNKIQEVFSARMKVFAEKVKKTGSEYLEKFVSDGAEKTASGLAYKIENAGSGKKPKAEDVVEVHYHGTLIDGTVFDSSKERNTPVSFPLNRVIKGWTEGLQLVGEGGKIRLVIPSDLAYGDAGAPPKIPGGSTLVFEVELISVKGPEAAKPAAAAAPAPRKPSKKKM